MSTAIATGFVLMLSGCKANREVAPALEEPYLIPFAHQPIVVDGKRDERAWRKARRSREFVPALGGPRAVQPTYAYLLWDDRNLYFFIEMADIDVFSEYHGHDEPLWNQDVIELFIDADQNGRGYVELQVNPNNAQFDAWFATTRGERSDFGWNAGMRSAVLVRGTADTRSDTDTGWNVEIAVPLEAVRGKDPQMPIAIPPKPGDQWRLNIVRGDKPVRGPYIASSWNQIPYSDFHSLGHMLTVVFAKE